eukprot:CAMPEP_0176106306 /NCGR_PEP_ID=MMETSP0120_2-20121206/53348_1 /TAXON_ID=160619 /ORGANISM="Kryptoperidinium foliaceum, Strain CCMP 1326" /LENGTH=222 /DNA_ID=CAMNT_0017440429 /DNA_START=66 /DNA_END=734 /DNA_ORIENTATION=-
MTGMRLSLLALLAAPSMAAEGEVLLAGFRGSGAEVHTWKQMNDPVMGGRSTGTFHVENGLGIFDGEVVGVPFLKAPGFIKCNTVDAVPFRRAFPDVSQCKAISIKAMSANSYSGFFFSFGNAHPAEGKFFASGYKASFQPAVGEFKDVVIPFDSFTDLWDDATGQPIKTCAENPKYCPNVAALRDLRTMSFWAEGTAGKVHLEIDSVKAVGCSEASGKIVHV